MSLPKTHVDRKSEEIKIGEDTFVYLTMLPGDLLEWVDQYTTIQPNPEDPTKLITVQNMFKMTQCKLSNLIDAPYNSDQIHSIIGTVKVWKDLTVEQKWEILKHYKHIDKLINKMNRIDKPNGSEKKSSLKESKVAVSKTDSESVTKKKLSCGQNGIGGNKE